jgi:hypothetical protein
VYLVQLVLLMYQVLLAQICNVAGADVVGVPDV